MIDRFERAHISAAPCPRFKTVLNCVSPRELTDLRFFRARTYSFNAVDVFGHKCRNPLLSLAHCKYVVKINIFFDVCRRETRA